MYDTTAVRTHTLRIREFHCVPVYQCNTSFLWFSYNFRVYFLLDKLCRGTVNGIAACRWIINSSSAHQQHASKAASNVFASAKSNYITFNLTYKRMRRIRMKFAVLAWVAAATCLVVVCGQPTTEEDGSCSSPDINLNKNLAIANRSRVSCINTNNNTMTLKSGLEVTQGH